ncbi:thioredoxin [Pleomorphomonas koreensis]|uniref:thioredoxin n=1 Tax=Pleomorphomonas koreensis TaxID=257440 RepID=UPI0004048435|nr:thioredoxin [Pleomorphomonas koreensis]
MSSPTFTFGNGFAPTGTPAPATSPAPVAADDIVETTTRDFVRDVIDASKDRPVLVDFWADWCGPCKQLTPIIEKVVRDAKGKVRLVKMNIDDHPEVAGQLGIQSIPAVIAFVKGRAVDGFMGAQPESQVRQFIERVAGPMGPTETETLIAAGQEALAAGTPEAAADAFLAVLDREPDSLPAIAGLVRALTAAGQLEDARTVLGRVPDLKANDTAIAGARAELELAERAASVGDTEALARQVAADPADHQARFDLAEALAVKGDRQAAVDHLVEIVRRERGWNDEAARKQLVKLFEAWGMTDPSTLYGRRKLSSVLFS